MWRYNYTNKLCHYGIKGMKWGVRRYQNSDGSLTSAGEIRYNGEQKSGSEAGRIISREKTKVTKAKRIKKKGADSQSDNTTASSSKSIKSMTDSELREHISRLELEKKYRELLSSNSEKKKVSAGQRFISDVLEKSAKNIASQAVTWAMGTALNSITGQTIVNPKKGQKDK